MRIRRLRVVEEVESEIEQAKRRWACHPPRNAFPPDASRAVAPATLPPWIEVVALALGTDIADGALDRIAEIDLAFEIVLPGGRIRVFKIRHENIGAGVQRIDDHLAIDRARDLHTAVEQIVRNGRDRPFCLADVGGFGEEVRKLAGVDLLLAGARGGPGVPGGVLRTCGPVWSGNRWLPE